MAIGATGSEDAWQRTAYISVESSSTVKMQYEALSETIEIDMSERDIDKIDLLNLGQITKHGQPGICTITIDGYPIQAGTSDPAKGTIKGGLATGYFEVFANAGHSSTSQPLDLDMSNTLTRYRVAILWTDQDLLSDTAASASDSGSGSITVDGTPFTIDTYNGAILKVTSGSASGSYFMITDTTTSAFTMTAGDTPSSDGVSDDDSLTVTPTGSSALLAGSKAKRFVIADCICTSCKTSMTDGIVKQTLVFKGKCFDKSSNPLIKSESNDGSQILPWLGDYTPGSTYWA